MAKLKLKNKREPAHRTIRRVQKQVDELVEAAQRFAQAAEAPRPVAAAPQAVATAAVDPMTELVKRRFLRDHEPWLFQMEEDLAAARGDMSRIQANLEGARSSFLVKLLKFDAYGEEAGMNLLYAYFEPDQRSFWDTVCATQPPGERIKRHNQRLIEQALKDPAKCPAAERILPAIPLLTQPLMPWAAMTDDGARVYNERLIEAAQVYAKTVRDQHQNRGRELAGAGPPCRPDLPDSPFRKTATQQVTLVGGEPFAVLVTAQDGSQAVDLAPLNEYLLTLEQRIAAHFGHNAEVVKKAFHDAIVGRFGERRAAPVQRREYVQEYQPRPQAPRQAYQPRQNGQNQNKRAYAPRGGEFEAQPQHSSQPQPAQQQQQQQQPQQNQQQQQQPHKNFF